MLVINRKASMHERDEPRSTFDLILETGEVVTIQTISAKGTNVMVGIDAPNTVQIRRRDMTNQKAKA